MNEAHRIDSAISEIQFALRDSEDPEEVLALTERLQAAQEAMHALLQRV